MSNASTATFGVQRRYRQNAPQAVISATTSQLLLRKKCDRSGTSRFPDVDDVVDRIEQRLNAGLHNLGCPDF